MSDKYFNYQNPSRNPFSDFVFHCCKFEDPGLRSKIRISQSKAPLTWIPIRYHCYAVKMLFTLSKADIHVSWGQL